MNDMGIEYDLVFREIARYEVGPVLECRAFPGFLQGLGILVVAKIQPGGLRVHQTSWVGKSAYNFSGTACFIRLKNSSATAQSPHDSGYYSRSLH
jgi:hypothetical protein